MVVKGDYCEECSETAVELMESVEALHEQVATDFRVGLEAILDDFEAQNPGFVVPDYRVRP